MEELENTQNKTAEEITEMYDTLRESIRHYLSAKLMDTNEDNPRKVFVALDFGCVGMSTLDMRSIDRIFQEPSEGIIWVRFYGNEDYTELDDLTTEELKSIVEDSAYWE